jgi:hypothetical protein
MKSTKRIMKSNVIVLFQYCKMIQYGNDDVLTDYHRSMAIYMVDSS